MDQIRNKHILGTAQGGRCGESECTGRRRMKMEAKRKSNEEVDECDGGGHAGGR